jgi:protein-S-isoprenylcysteine O-methyltransferase Ste14
MDSRLFWVVFRQLIPAMWLAWALYWWLSARGVKADRRREGTGSRLGHIVPLLVAGALLVPNLLWLGPLEVRLLPRSLAVYLVAVALTAAGLLFSVWARLHIGRNWSGTVTIKQDHELVDDGPYRFVRHPIYTGLLVAFIGSALASDNGRGVLAVVIAFAALWRKLKLEERWMIETFGEAYVRYRERVPALVPRIF